MRYYITVMRSIHLQPLRHLTICLAPAAHTVARSHPHNVRPTTAARRCCRLLALWLSPPLLLLLLVLLALLVGRCGGALIAVQGRQA